MYIPEIFKYGSIISVPLFAAVAFYLIKQTHGYSFNKHTISQSIHFLVKPSNRILFRVNFIIKALLDLSFSLYVLNFFTIPLNSVTAISLIGSAVLFGSLGYFIEGKHTTLHLIIVYSSGVLWVLGQILVVHSMGKNLFFIFTLGAILIPEIVGFGSLFLQKTNVYLQIACFLMWYIWVFIFVFQYL